jgi:hypothetical protein
MSAGFGSKTAATSVVGISFAKASGVPRREQELRPPDAFPDEQGSTTVTQYRGGLRSGLPEHVSNARGGAFQGSVDVFFLLRRGL